MTVYLGSYSSVTLDLASFTITVLPCEITSVQIVEASYTVLNNKNYALSSSATLSMQLATLQTPACGYTVNDWTVSATVGPAPSNFNSITNTGLFQVGPIPSAANIAGTYTISVTNVAVNGQSYSCS